MGNNKDIQNVSKATIGRLPAYHRYLKEKEAAGERTISSTAIAEELHLNAVPGAQGSFGHQYGRGQTQARIRDCPDLIDDINRILGYDNVTDAVLVGAGGLGSALAGYDGFRHYGLNIVAVFDSDPERIDKTVNGIRVFDAEQIRHLVRRLNVLIGIICVPKGAAQQVADELIEGGVRAIWNFAPVHLNVPENIAVKNEDMAASLAILSKRLAEILNTEK